MARQQGTDFDNVNTGGNKRDRVKITDKISIFKFPEKKWVTLRLYGDIHSYATAWVKTKTKDGKPTKFPVDLPSYDPSTQSFDSTKYDPWYAYSQSERDSNVERDNQLIQVGRKFYMNALFRHLQKQQPSTKIRPTSEERESGFKDKDSDTWTPWQVVALSPTLIGKIKELKGLNTVTSKKTGATKTYSVSDEKYGRDIRVLYDSSKSPADQYQVVPGDSRTPLTEEELAFLRWDTSDLAAEPIPDAETKKEFESWAKRNGIKLKGGKAKGADEDDEDDEDEDDEDEDDEPKSKKSSKKAPPKGKGKKQVEEDEDDEDEDEDDEDGDGDGLDDDEDDEDEDDEPKSKKPAKGKGKKKVEEDEEDDEDSDDEDEDDEPKSKKKAPAKGKKKPVDDEDDEDLDDDEDDEDEDDEPKSKKSSKKAPPKGKKKPVDDEDDEDLDDDEDDEDEDDEPKKPAKKSSKKPAAKSSKGKKKPVDDDEDDDLDD